VFKLVTLTVREQWTGISRVMGSAHASVMYAEPSDGVVTWDLLLPRLVFHTSLSMNSMRILMDYILFCCGMLKCIN